MTRRIDLNCDLGEGAGHDAELMPLVSSANIACGGHAGDAATMRATLLLAKTHGVAAGAHPSWPDRVDFGRQEMTATPVATFGWVVEQIRALMTLAQTEGLRLAHVKPHGALYNQAARDPVLAEVLVRAVWAADRTLLVSGLAGSRLITAGRAAGLQVVEEVFADRRYRDDGSLEPRSSSRALITDPAEAVRQVLELLQTGQVTTVTGKRIALPVDTVCLHGDGIQAVAFARAVRSALTAAGIAIRAPGGKESAP
jgi:UPF0271 protein